MKHRIDDMGILCEEKHGEEHPKLCPVASGNGTVFYCDSKCAQFEYREATVEPRGETNRLTEIGPQAILHCCGRTIDLEEP